MLIEAIFFPSKSNQVRALCIYRTGNGKSLPIQCSATMHRDVLIVVVPLLSVGADQASNIYYSSDARLSIYAEHLDSIGQADDDVTKMRYFFNSLKSNVASRVSIILYLSPGTITNNTWRTVIKGLIIRNLIVSFVWMNATISHPVAVTSGQNFMPI